MTKTKQQQDIQKALAKLAKIDLITYAFIVTAIDKYCNKVLDDEEEHTLRAMENSVISGQAWISAAKEIEAALQ
jgi:hypothetical protein